MSKIKDAQTNIYIVNGRVRASIMLTFEDIDVHIPNTKELDSEKKLAFEKAMDDLFREWEFEYK